MMRSRAARLFKSYIGHYLPETRESALVSFLLF